VEVLGRGGGFHDPFDVFREVFGGGSIFEDLFGGTRSDPSEPQRGDDLRYDMEISFEDAAHGCEREITVTKPERCETCGGSGAEAGAKAKVCTTCGGRGQVISSRGIFSIAQTCPGCQGAGRVIDRPCRTCRGSGPQGEDFEDKASNPAWGGYRFEAAFRGQRRSRISWGAMRGPLCGSA
jgi:molecular chaperone DnaJ